MHQPNEAELVSVSEALMSCAAAEGLLRGMLVRLDFSAEDAFALHLRELDEALEAIAERRTRAPGVEQLARARDALHAACAAFDPWRFSSDPEHSHLAPFQAESLRLLETVRAEREAAAALLE